MKVFLRFGAAAAISVAILGADVTYTQTAKFEGGSLVEMMQKMASMPMMGRMKQAFEDQHYNVFVKGNKMARWSQMTSSIYDLDAGTVTNIDNAKRTYSTMTFEEMQQRADQMQQRMNKGQTPDLEFDVKMDASGKTHVIDGQTAKEVVITMTAKQASAQGQMVVVTHAWLVPLTPATKELLEFQRKLSSKFVYAFGGMGPGLGSAGKGLSAAMKEAMNQDGYPVLTDVSISGVTAAMGPMAAMGGGKSDPNTPLIQLQTQNQNFAPAAVDDSKFLVPAGFKEDKRGR